MGYPEIREAFSFMEQCTHLDQVQRDIQPKTTGCEECMKSGDRWFHLRLCMICGHVGCCDSSRNKHASKHSAATGHPVMKSLQPGENWGWCFVDKVEIDFS